MLLLAIAVAVGSLHGTITDVHGGTLPGVTLTVTSASYSATSVSSAKGEYAFENVRPGVYDVAFELSGFVREARRISIEAGDRVLRPVAMKLDPRTQVDEISIYEPPCVDAPTSRWDMAACRDYEFDIVLIAGAQRGDRSAIELLRRRYDEEPIYCERYRIGGALLGRVGDDRAIWNELAAHAANAIDFAGHPEKFESYYSSRDCDADGYERAAWTALDAISRDRRARPLLLRALASQDKDSVWMGIAGLGEQRDDSALPEIEKALQRVPSAAFALAQFHSAAADVLASKYLPEEQREEYAAVRDEETPP
jgi:hypothetical protein